MSILEISIDSSQKQLIAKYQKLIENNSVVNAFNLLSPEDIDVNVKSRVIDHKIELCMYTEIMNLDDNMKMRKMYTSYYIIPQSDIYKTSFRLSNPNQIKRGKNSIKISIDTFGDEKLNKYKSLAMVIGINGDPFKVKLVKT